MTQPDHSPDDPLEKILTSANRSGMDGGLRTALLAQTMGVIRFRRRLKRCLLPIALVGCYAAGMASAFFGRPGGGVLPRSAIEQTATALGPSVPAAPALRTEPGDSGKRGVASSKTSRIEALQRNADARLLEEGDVRGAVRGYSRILELASAEQRAISVEQDTWLMMALKDARAKELRHGRNEQN